MSGHKRGDPREWASDLSRSAYFDLYLNKCQVLADEVAAEEVVVTVDVVVVEEVSLLEVSVVIFLQLSFLILLISWNALIL